MPLTSNLLENFLFSLTLHSLKDLLRSPSSLFCHLPRRVGYACLGANQQRPMRPSKQQRSWLYCLGEIHLNQVVKKKLYKNNTFFREVFSCIMQYKGKKVPHSPGQGAGIPCCACPQPRPPGWTPLQGEGGVVPRSPRAAVRSDQLILGGGQKNSDWKHMASDAVGYLSFPGLGLASDG